jgi:hypothetical protein
VRTLGDKPQDIQRYTWLRALKDSRGEELRRRYGAHSLGIGRKQRGGERTGELALIFYVNRKAPGSESGVEMVPPILTFTPPGANGPVEVPTDVVVSAPAELE